MSELPLKPRCALRVGIVGNRRFAREPAEHSTPAADRMRSQAAEALDAVWKALIKSIGVVLDHAYELPELSPVRMRDLFSAEAPRMAVLSSLAAGGDQIGAEAALNASRRQSAIAVELEAVLPFDEDYYPGPPGAARPEFRDAEANTLRALAAKACQVIRLSGEYNDDVGRRRGYEQARDLLLENSDILIAIYDPQAEGSAAGTVETVYVALKGNTPVIAVLVSENEARIQVADSALGHDRSPASAPSPVEWQFAYPLRDPGWSEHITACVRHRLVLPELLLHRPDAELDHSEEGIIAHALRRLRLMSGTERPPALCTNRLLATTFNSMWKGLNWLARISTPPDLAKPLQQSRLPDANALIRGAAAESNAPERASVQDPEAITLEPYASFYRGASALSGDYMRTYRGAFVMSYLLASLAVAAAVAMMAVMLLWHRDPPPAIIAVLCIAKIAVLSMMLMLVRAGHNGRLQEAAADFRYLAELLRPMQWLTPVGTYPPAVELPLYSTRHDPRRSWMAWLARAVARSSSCVALNVEGVGRAHPVRAGITPNALASALDAARTEWIEGQASYHLRTAARMRTLELGLERMAKGMLWTVLVAAVIACVLDLAMVAEPAAVILGTLAAVLPALIAALAGTAFQSEAKRLATRSEAMYHALREQQTILKEAADQIRQPGLHQSIACLRVTSILQRLSAITIAEAGDWKVLYQVHEIRAG